MESYYSMLSRHRDSARPAFIDAAGRAIRFNQLFEYADTIGQSLTRLLGDGNCAVGVLQDKSLTAVVSIFGVLAGNKVFVPISPTLPVSRRESIVKATSMRVVLVDYALDDAIALELTRLGLVLIFCSVDEDGLRLQVGNREVLAGEPAAPVFDAPLSHILFTSGTTGTPKGVMIKAESQAAFTRTMAAAFGHDSATRWLSVSPLYFDVVTLDLFVEVYCGATVYLYPPGLPAAELAYTLEKHAITDVLFISSVVKMLASEFSELKRRDLSYLRQLWYGGEPCPVEALRKIKQWVPQVGFAQCYGPTEVCNNSTLMRFDDVPSDRSGFMPLGKPIDSVEAYVVDADGQQLTAPGIGELYLGGVQVMAGYLGDPSGTAKKLLSNRFNPASPYPLFRTGDFVHLDADGLLWFHGRQDDLVKVRGNRISLHEVQAAIVSEPEVADAIVRVAPDSIGGFLDALEAVVICHQAIDKKTLTDRIRARLPAYMVPDRITIELRRDVPIKENGKLDRQQVLSRI
ncbi:amino acid adenylation domain-containing protein [Trinickia terrae]|uniref:Amino acid adenylation domain-containing protein n=1 Tax=Trinickia terrae TaxID=2571161 RepID=A0A4U1HX86_9BURK|nr:AMP-binding protein [Trinickia terrae]TKC86272.1 amino acid adenylation domain-containing protein [Trinickia terrae]